MSQHTEYGSQGYSSLKVFLVIVNFLSSLSGLALIGVAIYGAVTDGVARYHWTLPLFTGFLGVMIFFVSFLGCFGAGTESKRVLASYLAGLMVLFVAQLVVLILGYVYSNNVDSTLDKFWQDAYDNHPRSIKKIEHKFECCGFRKILDRPVPNGITDTCSINKKFGYDEPCYDALLETYNDSAYIFATTGIIVAMVQLVALISSGILVKETPDSSDRTNGLLGEHSRLLNSRS
ncbi:Tetraspannin-domain-containing protein [Conidiobolus coronatus NRRL 28638]|uniref:Tetraspannin-domain-containing protein n=1 Tax=Conidiobolus coronatus (strain ATCC 28846 / CBS 209.66 / NRRL 28638) TaxID=796925 RepID=A0A137PA10_CONC2|nr:Tetraspannin-domain-containing protein [Conidiobolus coronatus NRRL 28638]|eukprot:KXN71846.1 Tetraspannin-domain-containing protein [Conidiobolus coronatus NRRL 28638]